MTHLVSVFNVVRARLIHVFICTYRFNTVIDEGHDDKPQVSVLLSESLESKLLECKRLLFAYFKT